MAFQIFISTGTILTDSQWLKPVSPLLLLEEKKNIKNHPHRFISYHYDTSRWWNSYKWDVSKPEGQAPTQVLERSALEISPFLKTECLNSNHLPFKLNGTYEAISDLTPPSAQTSTNPVAKQIKAPFYFSFFKPNLVESSMRRQDGWLCNVFPPLKHRSQKGLWDYWIQ